jgi:Carbohydrate binding domain.
MRKITLLLSFFLCAVLSNAQTNLVVNPGFETWTDSATPAANWTPTVATGQTFAQEAAIIHSGTFSLLSNHTGTAGTAKVITKPYISVTAGTTYTFSFWYYTDASTTNLTSGLRMWGYWENPDGSNGTFDQTGLQPTAYIDLTSSVGIWKQFSTDITAPTGSGQLELDIRFYKGTKIYIDDVSLTQKPTALFIPKADALNVSLAGKKITITNSPSNTIDIFNIIGSKLQTVILENNEAELNLSKGTYIVRAGNSTAKIML